MLEAGGGAAARREQNRREMRTAILDAARTIVDEQGAGKLTLRGIAQRLGYSAGAIYDYFPSKDHILHALYFLGADGLGQQLQKTVDDLPEDTPTVEAILALARTYRAYAHANVDLYWLAFSGLKERPEQKALLPMLEDAQGVGFEPLLRVITAGIANGTLSATADPMAVAIAAWSSVHGFVSLELSGHLEPEVLGDQVARIAGRNSAQVHDAFFAALTRMVLYGIVAGDTRADRS